MDGSLSPKIDDLMAHLVSRCIAIASAYVDKDQAREILAASGWQPALDFIFSCYNDVLAKHTAPSWYYEEDLGQEEETVRREMHHAEAASELTVKLNALGHGDLYSDDAIEVLKSGLLTPEPQKHFSWERPSHHLAVRETAKEALLYLHSKAVEARDRAKTELAIRENA